MLAHSRRNSRIKRDIHKFNSNRTCESVKTIKAEKQRFFDPNQCELTVLIMFMSLKAILLIFIPIILIFCYAGNSGLEGDKLH
jgi:uncharacterized membrane protein (DUF106 family)